MTVKAGLDVRFTISPSQICRSDYLMKQEPPTSDWPNRQPETITDAVMYYLALS